MITEKPRVPESINITMEQAPTPKEPPRRRWPLVVAGVFGVLVLVGFITAAVYVGHKVTQTSYQEAKMFFQDQDGTVVEEKVLIGQQEVNFEASGRFAVVYDYGNMLATIRAYGENGDQCYLTSLSPDMGTIEEIKNKINTAAAAGGYTSEKYKTVEFEVTNRTAEIPATNTKATQLCAGLPVSWLARLTDSDKSGLVKRAAAEAGCGPGDGKKDTVVVVVIIIIVRKPAACT